MQVANPQQGKGSSHMSDIPTPKTDAEVRWTCGCSEAFQCVEADFAREQERTIAELVVTAQWFLDRQAPIQSKFDLHGPTDTALAMRDAYKRLRAALAKAGAK